MHYHEAANFLLELRRFRSKPGTESTARLLSELGDPHEDTTYVQIAGSNGKGSTARMVESICRTQDLDVGLYTSPHLDDVRERIRVNGRKIPEARVTEFVSEVREYLIGRAATDEHVTFFEALTAMALWYFGQQNVDVAVLEVGIGGRLDATSVVDPKASAVTSVSLEHTELLGDTVEEIARDKATVSPADGPLVTGAEGDALAAIEDVVDDVLTVGQDDSDVVSLYGGRRNSVEAGVEIQASNWSVDTTLPLIGEMQARNAGIAAVLSRQVTECDTSTVATGLRNAHWPGRIEVVQEEPTVLLDGAHNPAASSALAEAVSEFDFATCHLVFGAMHDKNHREMAANLPESERVLTCRADTERAADPEVLATVFEETGRTATPMRAVADAVDTAVQSANPDDLVLICGSLSVVAEARPRWTRRGVIPSIESKSAAEDVLDRVHVPQHDQTHISDAMVHKTIHMRVRPRQARILACEFRDLGGTAALSGIAQHDSEPVSMVLSGTLEHFTALRDTLKDSGDGLGPLADSIYERVREEPPTQSNARRYPWSDGTAVMGILNVTPDSFHDGGQYDDRADAITRAEAMVAAGADIVDVGGESTRPGADPVPIDAEIERVVPVIEAIADLDVAISIDTRKAPVARAALEAGADILNDVSGLEDPEMRFVAAEHDVPLIIMHSIDTPVDPTADPEYDDVVTSVLEELVEPVQRARQVGLDPSQIVVDPGLGFGKTGPESLELIKRLPELSALGCPILVGHSHKSMFDATGFGEGDRTIPTVTGTALAVEHGADIVRVHDVEENVAAVRIVEAVDEGSTIDTG